MTTDARNMKVLEGYVLPGKMNTSDEVFLAHVQAAIRRGIPQLRKQPPSGDQVCLVGGGPSLESTLPELVELLQGGAKLVTMNGAYHWALAHHLIPQTQVVLDARPTNARFVSPALPRCNYLVASCCHAEVWDALEGRDQVWMFHPFTRESEPGQVLERYFLGMWEPVVAGTTVASRALIALRMLGYLRFHLFGVDSCWLDGQHHAYDQPENAGDKPLRVRLAPPGVPEEQGREFVCSGWHIKQLEDFLQIIRMIGEQFLLTVHGDGMLAYALESAATTPTIVKE